MEEEPKWMIETKWILSAVATLLAILVVFWGLIGVWGSFATALSPSQSLSSFGGQDRIRDVLGMAIDLPIRLIVILPLYFLGALLGFRLLVPTFAGVPPRLVGTICTTWPIALGAVYAFADPLGILLITGTGVAWGLLMPLPRKNLLDYGPLVGGAIIGLAFAPIAYIVGLLPAIIWTAWRLYRRHAEEVIVTAFCAALLPGILALHDLSSAGHGLPAAFTVIQIVMLLAIGIAGAIMSTFRQTREG